MCDLHPVQMPARLPALVVVPCVDSQMASKLTVCELNQEQARPLTLCAGQISDCHTDAWLWFEIKVELIAAWR